ncbi:GCN1 activator of EIF2AK4 [Homo sapiens]|uniref:Stalled ribosome sensor GCN1 n=2 Tax=Homo sapiens TaxID=9606 RepID=GCN1_HUMAN|nr:stalled ribosome sensor GCN1 [Homo sapiens]Q92616.7 RecName: Full=Stalled ribosome sensor GCN1; AltName: Full=GCN1 eIF-2-alpha kinase activator homolog; AltName: Full=GCN1-like protein 1; AltName: Full=General control of amino-acid synthesis 1-like protein 1; AltName: Full=Translational activator GCN1; Short=HsGCN1 [Homo sapiens]KAI2568264.1 GCN1 activator of EIF2AK4 [Homo sapiens]KAI4068514.1 GCN1 activator of EIF2AK4 [Homo sapiens]|eukprot:NP_006827.1 eIF-2-alpha kinase activator GCN1 [Homo sapiens]
MAADTQVSETLKRFAGKVTTASVKERREILSELGKCVAGKDLPEGAVKGLCKLFCLTLHRYRDAASRRALQAAIQQLAEAQPEATAKNLLHSLQSSGIGSKAGVPSKSSGSAALLALTWTCLLVRIVFPSRAKRQGDIWNKLVEVQCLLLLEVLGGSHKHAVDGAVKKLTKLWKENPGLVEQYLSAILSLEPNQNYAGMLGLLVQFCTSHKEMDVVSQHKSALLDFYMKNILMSKVKPPKYLLDSCAPLLRYLSHSEFKDLILPTIQKSLLRSPENVIETISSLLASVTLDLSQYAMDIVKGLAGHLKSNSPRLMDEAVLALRNLARQCSDSSAMESLTKHLFAILGGSEGKLTVVAQKMSVLSGIGSVSHHVVSGPSSQVLNGIVAELFIPFLQQEVHEGTLVHAVSVLALWCNRFTMEVPKKLTEWFKKAFSLKTSTSAVRHAYLQCMLASYRGDTLLQALDLLPLLIQTVEKAASQSTQVPTITEGVAAALLLLKLSVADSQAEAKLSSFWQLIVDEKKQVFTSEKFLVMASEDALCTVLHLTERLFLDHPHRLTGNKVQQYHRALVAVLLSRTWHVRRQAQQTVRKLLSSLGGFKLAHGLLEELKTVLSSHKVLPLEALVTDAGEVTEAGKAYVPPRVLQEALCVISGVPGLKGDVTDTEQLAQEMLIISHHPSLVAVQSGLWPALLARMKIDPEAFITRHLDQIIPRMTTQSPLNQSSMNAMGSLSVLSPDRVLPQLISTITASVQNPALRLVTREEFAIMQTPAGELYDKSIIQSAQQDSIKKANMKRENKAYSFKEQIIELELKEEIKKKKGIKEEVQLTSKQKEMLQAQLDREAQVRRRLQELDGELEAALGLLDIILAKNPSGLTQYIPVLVDSFLPLLKSPLAAPRIKNPFLSLAACVMPSRLKALGTLVSHVTLRLLKPECVLDKSWCQEELSVAVKRAVMLLHTHTITSRVGKGEPGAAPLSAPAFSLVFPFLKMVLTEMPHHSEEEEEWMAQILQILTVQAQLRASPNTPPGRVDENGPELLPRVAMLRLLTWVIGTGSPRLQVLASDTLTTLCASSSGDDGCAFAEQEEVDVLLCALQSPCASVRETVLRGLMELHMVLPAPDTDEKNGLNLLRRLWVVKFDKEEEIRKLAERLWSMMGLDLQPDLCSLLIDDVIYHEAAVRQAGAEALSQAVARYQRQAAEVMGRLMEIYQEKLYRPPPVLDALGRVISESPPDQWEARCGLALALNKLSQYLDSSQVKPLFQFFVPDALNDRHPDVRKCMLDAALATLNTHGKENVNSLLPVFEEFLKNAPNDASYDAVRQSVVVLMGSLAKHLDKSDPKVKPIVAKLIAALSTPSQQVQESVASCLPPLVPAIKEDAGGMIQRLMQQLLESDKYAERKGAAYGLAGLVKGLGILSLKQQEMMAALTDAIQDKKNFRRREGALFAFEMLCTMLGKLFEPYVVHVLPHLLLCFGDGNQYVREAADDCAKAVMSNLSAHGVKLVLPSLLAALEEESWRTKAGSVELLGAMAYCAPKQLSSCLPNIVPKLTEVLTDSHVKVQKAGQQALRQIGSVIRNPEILAIAPVLLDALTDPSRKTQKCLQTLLDTKFVHFIDAPSLALIMPIVQRAFQDRSTDTRKMAAQIIGNMYSLTDQKDLAPYLPSVTPGLKASLLDPVPEVRTVSAKALGAMVKGMGESCFEDLLPWLMETLTYEQSSVDRSGAAQGLAEVMAGLGVEKLEKLMPEIVATASKVDIAPHVRDGYIMMFNYLPITFGDKFTPYVGPIIPCILKALADENEFVRDTALRAGQRVISMYAETAIALLLPQLEQGLFDDLWRIRFSSVQLLGDLLFHISGVTGKMTTETASEDDNFGTAQSNKAIITALGVERRNRVLAGLYMGRSDTQLVVRQASLHVWKIVVSNTPRTLREILPTLFGLLLGFLASTCADKRTIAARTLGDLVRKLGEKILPEIIPILEEGLRSQKSDERQGVCIGLSEIMKSTSRDAVLYFSESLVPTARKALCDPLEEVREAAAKTFEQLHSTIGHQALEDILPFLLKQLDDEEVSEFALDGLKQVMAIKSRVVLPYLVPKLTTPPVNTRVLAFLSSVAGDALTRHLGVILPAVMLALKEKLGTPDEQLEMANCQAVILSVEDDTGHRIIIEDLLEATRSPEVGMRQAAAIILNIYCSRSKADYTSHLRSLVSGLIRLFNDSSPVVLEESWDALNAITKKLDAGNQLALIEELHKEIRLIGNESKGEHVPGFCLPKKGVTSILPVLREGVLTGSPEQKEEAAKALGLVIRLTSADALRPSVVSITGPLIRILGDRFSWNVKAALLETLSLLLAKVGIALKPFLPQLQTTFTKALQDSNRGVRLKAADALGKLISIHIKVDPLFTELLNGIRAMEDPGVRDTMLQALRFVIQGAGAKVDAVIRKNIVSLLLSMLGHDEDNTRISSAGCLGELCAFLTEEELSAVLQQCLLADVSGIDWMVRHGRSLALSVAVNVAPGRLCAGRYSSDVQEMILSSATADRIPIAVSGVRGMGFLMRHHIETGGGQLPAKLSSLFVKCLQNPSSDIRLVAEKMIWWANKDPLPPLDPQAIKPILKALLDNTKDKNTVVRAYSDQAIVNLLKMRQGEEVFQSLSKILDVASLEVLNEVNRRSLKKLASQADSTEQVDDTILT